VRPELDERLDGGVFRRVPNDRADTEQVQCRRGGSGGVLAEPTGFLAFGHALALDAAFLLQERRAEHAERSANPGAPRAGYCSAQFRASPRSGHSDAEAGELLADRLSEEGARLLQGILELDLGGVGLLQLFATGLEPFGSGKLADFGGDLSGPALDPRNKRPVFLARLLSRCCFELFPRTRRSGACFPCVLFPTDQPFRLSPSSPASRGRRQ